MVTQWKPGSDQCTAISPSSLQHTASRSMCDLYFRWQNPGSRKTWVEQTKKRHTHTRLTALFPELPRWAGTRKVKPIWILLKQETVSGSGISWAICKSASRSRQITMPAPHCSFFYGPDALPAAQQTASKHWRYKGKLRKNIQSKWNFTHIHVKITI